MKTIFKNNLTTKLVSFVLCMALLLSIGAFVGNNNDTSSAASYTYFSAGSYTEDTILDAANALNEEVVGEGVVLLKNENNALPITKASPRVSVFGKHSVNLQYGLSGSSGGSGDANLGLYDALEEEGFVVNTTLEDFYKNNSKSGAGKPKNDGKEAPGMDTATMYGIRIGETPQASYTADIKSSYSQYNDAAIVVLSRIGGESYDLFTTMKTSATSTTAVAGARSATDHYLQLDQNETDLLKALDADPAFSTVIILVNSPNAMELGFLDDPTHYAYSSKIKAAIWMGLPGATGNRSVAKVLNGKINPSGRLTDIMPRNFKEDPTFNNFSNGGVASGNVSGSAFVHYDEDIYMGYRYWETRALTAGETWYDQSVVYPFGHGLSYTNFSWQLLSQVPAQGASLTKDGTITATVRVTNTGTVAGKDVVELYYTAPYTAGGISKSHVVLGQFEKTGLIQPGAYQDVVISMKVSDMYSYDWSDANGNSFKGYELDGGNYTISLAKSSHCNTVSTVDDSASIKLNYSVPVGGYQYSTDTTTGGLVENLFDDVSGTGKTNAAPFKGVRQYLSRDDWEGTWPTTNVSKKSWGTQSGKSVTATSKDTDPWYVAPENMPTQAASKGTSDTNKIKLWHMIGRDYDDPLWDSLLDQLTIAELGNLVADGFFTTTEISSIDKPRGTEQDGPFGFVPLTHSGGKPISDTARYASPVMIAQTFNKELAYELGQMLGMEGILASGGMGGNTASLSGIYAPGLNTHRSQFGGRNGEYYSEDPYLAGMIAANYVAGANSKGVHCYMKHFVLNDQETNRGGLITWLSEQALREIYARSYELAVKEGGAMGVMTGFNRVGQIKCTDNYALLTSLLRDEWGFRGSTITDWGDGSADVGPRVGLDLQLCGNSGNAQMEDGSYKAKKPTNTASSNTATHVSAVRKAAKNILYTAANSNAMNGYGGSPLRTTYNNGQKLNAVANKNYSFSIAQARNEYAPTAQYTYSVTGGSLPAGVALLSNGTLTGTPISTGTSTFTVTARDASESAVYAYSSASTTYTLNVVASPINGIIYDDNTIQAGAVGTSYSYSVGKAQVFDANQNATGSGITYALKVGSALPSGLSMDSNGLITGTPAMVGGSVFTVVASKDGYTPVELQFSLSVNEFNLVYIAPVLQDASVNQSYSANVGTAEGAPNLTYALKSDSKLPAGLTMDTNGQISGTPTSAVTDYKFTVIVSSTAAPSVEAELSLTINGLVFESFSKNIKLGQSTTMNLVATPNDGGSASGITYALAPNSGRIPNGMTLNANGTISGKPNTLGKFVFSIVASKDGYSDSTTEFVVTVVEASGKKEKKGCGSISTEGSLFAIGTMLTSLIAIGFVASKKKVASK